VEPEGVGESEGVETSVPAFEVTRDDEARDVPPSPVPDLDDEELRFRCVRL